MTSTGQGPISLKVPVHRHKDGPFHINIQLGGNAPIEVLLDTGSTGIVIGQQHLPPSAVKMNPQPDYKAGYTSSGKSYGGAWYSVDVTIPGTNGSASTVGLPVFGATNHPGVAMCGVGVNGDKPASFNPFLTVERITVGDASSTAVTQGYTLSKDGISLGLTPELADSFPITAPLDNFQATVHLVPKSKAESGRYHFTARALVDSGIGYMILNPSLRSVTDAPPGFCNKETGHFLDGTSIKFDGGISYDLQLATLRETHPWRQTMCAGARPRTAVSSTRDETC